MRVIEAAAAALVVAGLTALVAWRVDADPVLGSSAAALLMFLAVVLRTRTPGRMPSIRRRPNTRGRADARPRSGAGSQSRAGTGSQPRSRSGSRSETGNQRGGK